MFVHGRVGSQFQGRRRLVSVDRTAAGGEGHQVAAGRHLAGDRNRVVAGTVHEGEALGGDRLGIFIDAGQIGRPTLGNGAQRLLQDGGQAARLVAGRRIIVHAGAVFSGVIFPPADAFDQLLADILGHRAPGQQMFGAVDLRRFCQHAGASMAHQVVDG